MLITTRLIVNFLSLLLLLISITISQASAQTVTLPEDVAVSAVVIDRIPPTTPILISPADDSKLKTGTVPFVWQASSDAWLMDHYTLVINGATHFDTIPLTATTNASYTLTYDVTTQYYTLTPASNLSDGSYTWSVIANDYHGNQATSVTWDFSIDTNAPVFTITKIENQTVEITTQDADSVPASPTVLEENEPVLSGTGEGSSTVVLTITLEDGTEDEVTFTIGSDGNWSVTLETLPRDEEITLDFLITDVTGNVSILTDVLLILYSDEISIPSPIEIPGITQPGAENQPIIIIPANPPIEYIPHQVRDLPKRTVYYVRNNAATLREDVIIWWEKFLKIGVLLLLLIHPLIKLGVHMLRYRKYLSWLLFTQMLWLVGWWHKQNPQGIIVTRDRQEPIRYSLVFVSGVTTTGLSQQIQLMSNDKGVFPVFSLPDGEYRISVQHPSYFFPTLSHRPQHLKWNTFYTGTSFSLKNGSSLPLLVIPVEQIEKPDHIWLQTLRDSVLLSPSLNFPLVILSICICLAIPSYFNFLSVGTYAALLFYKKVWLPRIVKVFIAHNDKAGASNVIIAIEDKSQPLLHDIAETNEKGFAKLQLPPDVYKIKIIDFKQRLAEGDNKTATVLSVDASENYPTYILN